jgi:hypothetical protein
MSTGREVAPPPPPMITIEGLLRDWARDDVSSLVASVLETRWGREVEEVVAGRFDVGALVEYAARRYLPPGALSYYMDIVELTRDSSARESRVAGVILDRLSRAESLAEAKMVVDESVETYIGLRPYVGIASLAPAILQSIIPAPPEGIPSISGPYRPGNYYVDAEVAQILTITPEPRGSGPLFFTRNNHAWEVEFVAEPGREVTAGVTVWFLWEYIYCILFRYWIPVRVGVWTGNRILSRFNVSINYKYVTAYAIQPAWSSDGRVAVTLRKII